MGFMVNQLQLLLQEDWLGKYGAQRLSEQLFAMFSGDSPIQVTSPVQIQPTNPNAQPLQLQPPENATLDLAIKGSGTPLQIATVNDLPPTDASGGTPGATVRQVVIRQVQPDTLIVDDQRDSTFLGAIVAKPPTLRSSAVGTGTATFSNTSTDGQTRTATYTLSGNTFTESQLVVPAYVAGQTINIIQVMNGVADASSPAIGLGILQWIDMNLDARTWATVVPADNTGLT